MDRRPFTNVKLIIVIKRLFEAIGKYFQMLWITFSKPEKFSVFAKRTTDEIFSIGMSSIPIVAIMSFFMGSVVTMQTGHNMDSPLLPAYTLGFVSRSSIVLEFSPTIMSLILAGKVGSNIASEIGTMRTTEQIDALEIMGVNSLTYLVLPKMIGAMFFFPILIIISIGLGLLGGAFAVYITGFASLENYIFGLRAFFEPYDLFYALTKSVFFAFIITSVSSFYGYYTKGGSIDVGRSSTEAVVTSSIVILIVNLLLTQIMLF